MDPETLKEELGRLHQESFAWALTCCDRDANEAQDVLQVDDAEIDIDAEVPQKLLAFVAELVSSPVSFLILLLLFLLVLGAILDIFSAIVLVVPLILPIAAGFGVNEVHLGIVFLAAMQLGYLTPPVGLNLFIASYRFEKPILHVYSATFPFLMILLLSVILIAFWPSLSLVFVSGQ